MGIYSYDTLQNSISLDFPCSRLLQGIVDSPSCSLGIYLLFTYPQLVLGEGVSETSIGNEEVWERGNEEGKESGRENDSHIYIAFEVIYPQF